MTIPSWYALLLLGLGVYRICRLVGWDDITAPLRARWTIPDEPYSQWTYALNALQKIGADPWRYAGWHSNAFALDVGAGFGIRTGNIELPPLVTQRIGMFAEQYPGQRDVVVHPPTGGLPPGVSSQLVPFTKGQWYVAKLIRCPWCLGWWLAVAAWIAYQAAPRGTLIVLSLFALSAVPGLVAKNLDQ